MTKLQFLLLTALISGSGKDLLASGEDYPRMFMDAARDGNRQRIEDLISNETITPELRTRASGIAGGLRYTELADFIRTWTPIAENVLSERVIEPSVTPVETSTLVQTELAQDPALVETTTHVFQTLVALALRNAQQQTPNLQENAVRPADEVMTDTLVNEQHIEVNQESIDFAFTQAVQQNDHDKIREIFLSSHHQRPQSDFIGIVLSQASTELRDNFVTFLMESQLPEGYIFEILTKIEENSVSNVSDTVPSLQFTQERQVSQENMYIQEKQELFSRYSIEGKVEDVLRMLYSDSNEISREFIQNIRDILSNIEGEDQVNVRNFLNEYLENN